MMSSSSGFQSAAGAKKQRMQQHKRMASSQLSWNPSRQTSNFIGSKPVKQYGWNGSMSGTQIKGFFTPNIINHSVDYGQGEGENDFKFQGESDAKINQDLHTSPTTQVISPQYRNFQ